MTSLPSLFSPTSPSLSLSLRISPRTLESNYGDCRARGVRSHTRRAGSIETARFVTDPSSVAYVGIAREIGEVYDEYVAKMKEELNCDDAYNAEKGLQASEVRPGVGPRQILAAGSV